MLFFFFGGAISSWHRPQAVIIGYYFESCFPVNLDVIVGVGHWSAPPPCIVPPLSAWSDIHGYCILSSLPPVMYFKNGPLVSLRLSNRIGDVVGGTSSHNSREAYRSWKTSSPFFNTWQCHQVTLDFSAGIHVWNDRTWYRMSYLCICIGVCRLIVS
jgi:hypothetical protein